jgi:hypothetical protein
MDELPLIRELQAELLHEMILELLEARCGPVPRDVSKRLRAILDHMKLKKLNLAAAKCADMEAFRAALLTWQAAGRKARARVDDRSPASMSRRRRRTVE